MTDTPTYPRIMLHIVSAYGLAADIDPVATQILRDKLLEAISELAFVTEGKRIEDDWQEFPEDEPKRPVVDTGPL